MYTNTSLLLSHISVQNRTFIQKEERCARGSECLNNCNKASKVDNKVDNEVRVVAVTTKCQNHISIFMKHI
jgi:hypothetical protein